MLNLRLEKSKYLLAIFTSENEKENKAMEVRDVLNIRFGKGKVKLASQGFSDSWKRSLAPTSVGAPVLVRRPPPFTIMNASELT